MRVWDIDAGYLSDRSLLGEHREVHGIFSIIQNGKKGYSRHPETLRWVGHLGALVMRHAFLVEEMRLRGFRHKSPIEFEGGQDDWPADFIDEPCRQYEILQGKYLGKRAGRIPLPPGVQDLWASHKYSMLARDPDLYRATGQGVAAGGMDMEGLALQLVTVLRKRPAEGRLENALLHMWGYISHLTGDRPHGLGKYDMLNIIREKALSNDVTYLLKSTALGELGVACGR